MGESEIITQKKAELLIKEMKDFIVSAGWTHKIQITQSELYEKSANKMRIAKINNFSIIDLCWSSKSYLTSISKS